jgi:hypothetical protein
MTEFAYNILTGVALTLIGLFIGWCFRKLKILTVYKYSIAVLLEFAISTIHLNHANTDGIPRYSANLAHRLHREHKNLGLNGTMDRLMADIDSSPIQDIERDPVLSDQELRALIREVLDEKKKEGEQ